MLNSEFVQWLVKFAFSKSGVVIRWAIGYVMGYIAAKNIVPTNDIEQIQISLTSGLTALVALAYAGLQYWLNSRQKKAVAVVQEMVGTKPDGVAGNNTVIAAAKATGENLHAAISSVNSNPIH